MTNCISDGKGYSSSGEFMLLYRNNYQKRCKNCRQFWFANDPTPICKPIEVPSMTNKEEINQCDGCQLGLPVDKNGNHNYSKAGEYPNLIGCTKDRYKEENWNKDEFSRQCPVCKVNERVPLFNACAQCHTDGITKIQIVSTPKDDWETKEREAFKQKFPYQFGLVIDKQKIADYFLARLRAAREEAYHQGVHETDLRVIQNYNKELKDESSELVKIIKEAAVSAYKQELEGKFEKHIGLLMEKYDESTKNGDTGTSNEYAFSIAQVKYCLALLRAPNE